MDKPKTNLELKAEIIKRFGSQGNFAYVTRTDEAIISKIVRGRRRPTEEQIATWSALLGCEPEKLFN